MNLVVLKLDAFFQTFCHIITTPYHVGPIQQSCEGGGTLVLPKKAIWRLLVEYSTVCVLNCFDVNPIRGLPALARK